MKYLVQISCYISKEVEVECDNASELEDLIFDLDNLYEGIDQKDFEVSAFEIDSYEEVD
jgi:hypothetical protein